MDEDVVPVEIRRDLRHFCAFDINANPKALSQPYLFGHPQIPYPDFVLPLGVQRNRKNFDSARLNEFQELV